MLNPMIHEIEDEYLDLRASGEGRDGAVATLLESYGEELQDPDDGPYVRLAIALALGRRGELTPSVAEPAEEAIRALRSARPELKPELEKAARVLRAPKSFGEEKPFKGKTLFYPDWNVGDTFIRKLRGPSAEESGLAGWYAVIRKIGAYEDISDKLVQLVVVSVCPPDAIPRNEEELRKLGNLKMKEKASGKADYYAKMRIGSSRAEKAFALEKIGCFPGVPLPEDQARNADLLAAVTLSAGKDRSGNDLFDRTIAAKYRWAESLSNQTGMGKKQRKKYVPDWKIGDTFIHAFESPIAGKCGVAGQYIVMRKVGEYRNEDDEVIQIVVMSVCPADAIPKTSADLIELGVIPMYPVQKRRDYRAQLRIVSKRGENALRLTKIGCFPDVGMPADQSGPGEAAADENIDEICASRTPDGDLQFEMAAATFFAGVGMTKIGGVMADKWWTKLCPENENLS